MLLMKFLFLSVNLFYLCNFCISACPPNTTPGNNGKCYSFLSATGGLETAERSCQAIGGHLVSICNAFENNLLSDLIVSLEVAVRTLQDYGIKTFWIGFNDLYNKGIWQWTSNSSCTYTNWDGGQPGNNDCASFQISTGKWSGSDCNMQQAFVCETYNGNITVKPKCKDGYSFYSEWNTCYKYFTTPLAYNGAEKSCVNDGGELVSIHSKNEETFIDNVIHEVAAVAAIWIGYYSSYPPNRSLASLWFWTDSTPMIYADWIPGYPTNASSCAYMYSSGNPYNTNGSIYWANSDLCTTPIGYMCKQFPICS